MKKDLIDLFTKSSAYPVAQRKETLEHQPLDLVHVMSAQTRLAFQPDLH